MSKERFSDAEYTYVHAVLKNTDTPFAESLLRGLEQFGRLTEVQMNYVTGAAAPNGKLTMEATLQATGWKYDPEKEEQKELKKEIITQPKDLQIGRATKADTSELASTNGYPYKFEHFNPVQTAMLPYRATDCNVLISAATSAGKTICAEIIMDEVLRAGMRVVYLSPLKALTREKYEDWQERYSEEKISILTGDFTLTDKRKAELHKASIIVMTSEMADSRTRRMLAEKNFWLREVGVIVVDESHIITTERGHAVESGLMRFTSINKKARVVLLSATMKNTEELGSWLTKMNGKPTQIIASEWRPVDLYLHLQEYVPIVNSHGGEDHLATRDVKIGWAVKLVAKKPNEKFLIFVHDKSSGREIVRRINSEAGTTVAKFHNADLELHERIEVEDSFEKRDGGLRILVSTSTLAWGSVAEGTLIRMKNGSNKKVESIRCGDEILSYNEKLDGTEVDFVSAIVPYEPANEYRITLKDGSVLTVDGKHPFYVRTDSEGLVIKKAQDLNEFDNLVCVHEL